MDRFFPAIDLFERQIIQVAGGHPPDEFILLERLESGALEEIEWDETVDLRTRGSERFVMARGSELYSRHARALPS